MKKSDQQVGDRIDDVRLGYVLAQNSYQSSHGMRLAGFGRTSNVV